MFHFQLKDCKNVTESRVTIEFLLGKYTLNRNVCLQSKIKHAHSS